MNPTPTPTETVELWQHQQQHQQLVPAGQTSKGEVPRTSNGMAKGVDL
jgi:hypothetical protein